MSHFGRFILFSKQTDIFATKAPSLMFDEVLNTLLHSKHPSALITRIYCFYFELCPSILSWIRQKGESQNGGKQENKVRQIFRRKKRTFLTHWYAHVRTCAYQGVRNVCFSENLAYFVFLKHPFWDSPFCLITDKITFFLRSTIIISWQDKSLLGIHSGQITGTKEKNNIFSLRK